MVVQIIFLFMTSVLVHCIIIDNETKRCVPVCVSLGGGSGRIVGTYRIQHYSDEAYNMKS